jgi:hypothetical protein
MRTSKRLIGMSSMIQAASANTVATMPHGPACSASVASDMIATPMCALSVHRMIPTTAAMASQHGHRCRHSLFPEITSMPSSSRGLVTHGESGRRSSASVASTSCEPNDWKRGLSGLAMVARGAGADGRHVLTEGVGPRVEGALLARCLGEM